MLPSLSFMPAAPEEVEWSTEFSDGAKNLGVHILSAHTPKEFKRERNQS
jgi:hypothetical protein